ncbi:MAG: twin-arginine translocation signal domain-containing protein, partial [Reyranella sp.]|nr:twin-arginine translocation signal domain-containing protein [Reyranella sp.]
TLVPDAPRDRAAGLSDDGAIRRVSRRAFLAQSAALTVAGTAAGAQAPPPDAHGAKTLQAILAREPSFGLGAALQPALDQLPDRL